MHCSYLPIYVSQGGLRGTGPGQGSEHKLVGQGLNPEVPSGQGLRLKLGAGGWGLGQEEAAGRSPASGLSSGCVNRRELPGPGRGENCSALICHNVTFSSEQYILNIKLKS